MQKYTPALTIISIILLGWAMNNLQSSLNILNEKMNYLLNRQQQTDEAMNELTNKYSIMDNIIIVATKSADQL